jgi:hypothetical protein
MYRNLELINCDDLLSEVPNPVERSRECYTAWFMPADGGAENVQIKTCKTLGIP